MTKSQQDLVNFWYLFKTNVIFAKWQIHVHVVQHTLVIEQYIVWCTCTHTYVSTCTTCMYIKLVHLPSEFKEF